MTEAETEALLEDLDLWADADGGAREQACFQSAAAIRKLSAEIARLRTAARPFAACVFADNGDITVSTSSLTTHDWARVRRVVAE